MILRNIFNLKTFIFFVIIFGLFLIFYFPVFFQIQCIRAPCNPVKEFITIFSINNHRVESINYFYLFVEALISLGLAIILSKLYDYLRH